jgi:hypothetical protein
VTRFRAVESPFKADSTPSNRTGFTLMNNQVGEVIAQVMATKPNVTVTYLPSMMRVDAVGYMEVNYDEISEALGEEPSFFDAAEFEEDMSTHYGRMIHEDDRTLFYANPEDAAEYLGFDLVPTTGGDILSVTRRAREFSAGDGEIASLEEPVAFGSAARQPSWARTNEPVTLVAVRRRWPSASRREESRSVLASLREESGQPTERAAAALDDNGFSRAGVEPRPSAGSYTLLPHAEAVLVRADPGRAAEVADILKQDFIVTPDVVLVAPHPDVATRIISRAEFDEQNDYHWPEQSGIEAAHATGHFGEGVVIGVFDTGCDADHAEFLDRTVDFVYVPPSGGTQRSVRGFATDWHGTHVAAIAAGRHRGIAPAATLLAAGVIESESYQSSLRRLITAMDWFEQRLESEELDASPAILNLSLGFPASLLESAQARPALAAVRVLLDRLIEWYRVLVVAAVGNDGPGAPVAPAFFPNVLSAGAVSLDGAPAAFSSGGQGPPPYELIDTPDVVGYGVDVMSAMQRDVPGVSLYRAGSGTSMAAPYVSGVAALVASDTGLQGLDLAGHLKTHALPLPYPPERVGSGLARYSLHDALLHER